MYFMHFVIYYSRSIVGLGLLELFFHKKFVSHMPQQNDKEDCIVNSFFSFTFSCQIWILIFFESTLPEGLIIAIFEVLQSISITLISLFSKNVLNSIKSSYFWIQKGKKILLNLNIYNKSALIPK